MSGNHKSGAGDRVVTIKTRPGRVAAGDCLSGATMSKNRWRPANAASASICLGLVLAPCEHYTVGRRSPPHRLWCPSTSTTISPALASRRSLSPAQRGSSRSRSSARSPRCRHEQLGRPLTGHTGGVWAVALGRVGERDVVASGGDDGTVRLWDAASGEQLGQPLTGHTGRVSNVALGRVGERDVVASASNDRTVRLWDAHTRTAVVTLDTLVPVAALVLAPPSRLYAACGPAICSFSCPAAAAASI